MLGTFSNIPKHEKKWIGENNVIGKSRVMLQICEKGTFTDAKEKNDIKDVGGNPDK